MLYMYYSFYYAAGHKTLTDATIGCSLFHCSPCLSAFLLSLKHTSRLSWMVRLLCTLRIHSRTFFLQYFLLLVCGRSKPICALNLHEKFLLLCWIKYFTYSVKARNVADSSRHLFTNTCSL